MPSMEELVEDLYKGELKQLGVKTYGKTEAINDVIEAALKAAESKSGGPGGNRPDIKALLDDGHGRRIPVMMEAKGYRNRLEKREKDGSLSDAKAAVTGFAVNGAIHYAKAIIDYTDHYSEIIAIGMNGSQKDNNGDLKDRECAAYYLSRDNGWTPKPIAGLNNDLTLLAKKNLPKLFCQLGELSLTEEEREEAKLKVEAKLERSVKEIHQRLYDDEEVRNLLGTNEKLYLFTALIMAGLRCEGLAPVEAGDLKGNDDQTDNDGTIIANRIKAFLKKRGFGETKLKQTMGLLSSVLNNRQAWAPRNGGLSLLRNIYAQVKQDVVPNLESPFHLDFAGKILNSLNDWVDIENDKANDVVLTPRYVTSFMARLCRTDKDSMVWDRAMGSAGFLVSAMDIMIRDARDKIADAEELEEKIRHIREEQLMGIEILGNIYILAILNMILMGDGSSNMIQGDSHKWKSDFPANVFLLNPPYSADGKGLIFVEEALSMMNTGYAAVLIQENAGAGQGGGYGRRILKNNSLIASIHMPAKLFSGKSSVQAAIYVFRVGEPHDPQSLVKFIDMSEDGYTRQNRRKSTQEVNLRDTGDAAGRYAEAEAIVLNKKPATQYYTKENGLYLEDTVGLEGNDWTFAQHKKIDTVPALDDFKKTVGDYLAWKVGTLMKG